MKQFNLYHLLESPDSKYSHIGCYSFNIWILGQHIQYITRSLLVSQSNKSNKWLELQERRQNLVQKKKFKNIIAKNSQILKNKDT